MAWFKRDIHGARTLIWVRDGSRTVMNFVFAAKQRRRKIIIAASVLIVVLGVATIIILRHLASQADARVVTTWSSLSRCLLGAPLAEDERASGRFRAIQLAALTQSDVMRAPEHGEPWPDRCALHAHQLHEALGDASDDSAAARELAEQADKLANELEKEGSFTLDLSAVVDATWEHASKASMTRVEQTSVPEPPSPAQPMSLDSLKSGQPLVKQAIDLALIRMEKNSTGALRFVVTDRRASRAPFLCSVTDTAAHCKTLPAEVAEATTAGLHLFGTADADAAPLVFAGQGGQEGVYRSDTGKRLAKSGGLGGYVAEDGFAAVLTYSEARKVQLVRQAQTGKQTRSSAVLPSLVKLLAPQQDAQVLWGHLLFRGNNRFDEVKLSAAPVQPKGGVMGKETTAGTLPPVSKSKVPATWPAGLSGCRTDQVIVARIADGHKEALSFWINDQWSKPLEVPTAGGTLACHRNTATLTRLDPGPEDSPLQTTVLHHVCTPAACTTHKLPLSAILAGELALAPSTLPAVAALDANLVVVWNGGSRGGLRLRVAAPDQIAKTRDVIVYDDLQQDGRVQKTSTLNDLRLLGGRGVALLLLSTSSGLYALRVKPDGTVTPAELSWK